MRPPWPAAASRSTASSDAPGPGPPPRGPGAAPYGQTPAAEEKGPSRIKLRVKNRREPSEVLREATVTVGEVVLIGDKGAVPDPPEKAKDVKRTAEDWKRIIGWIELDPKGVPEKELVEKKVPFVRPEKADRARSDPGPGGTS